jgi:hypothetical protein
VVDALLIVLDRSEGHLIATFDNVLVTAWRAPGTMEQLRALPRHAESLARRYPKGYGTLLLLSPDAVKASAEVRAEGNRVAKNPVGITLATANVLEGKGFGAAALRALMHTYTMLNPNRTPTRTFDTLPPAATWLMAQLGAPDRASHLAASVLEAVPPPRDTPQVR